MGYNSIIKNNLQGLTKVIMLLLFSFLLCYETIASTTPSNRRIFIEEHASIHETAFILYYTPLMDNIHHPESIYFLNKTTSEAEQTNAATSLPTYSAILVNKDRKMLARFNFAFDDHKHTIIEIEEYETGKDYILTTPRFKQIPEHRANEIRNILPIKEGSLPLNTVLETLDSLNKTLKLYQLKESNLYFPTQNEINDAFLRFSLENKEIPSMHSNEEWLSYCYNWALQGYQFGINHYNTLYLIYEYIYPEEALKEDIKEAIRKGFNSL